jgi:hypothetical protein
MIEFTREEWLDMLPIINTGGGPWKDVREIEQAFNVILRWEDWKNGLGVVRMHFLNGKEDESFFMLKYGMGKHV